MDAGAAGGHPEAGAARAEYPALHAIKAAAIAAVVVGHAGPFSADGASQTVLDRILRFGWVDFHVPAFVFVSGFLYQRSEPIPLREVARRLARLVPPYLVASLLGIASGLFRPEHPLWFSLATGSAIGIYYYVFAMAILIPFVWPLSRLPRGAAEILLASMLLHLVLAIARPAWLPPLGWFWGVRNPLALAPCFVAGWLVRAHLPRLAALARRHAALAWGLPLAVIAVYLGGHDAVTGAARRLARFSYTCSVVALLALATSRRPPPRPVRALSDATLTIYLYHIMVYQALGYMAHSVPALRIPVLATLGLGLGLAVAFGGRRLLGARSRVVFGA